MKKVLSSIPILSVAPAVANARIYNDGMGFGNGYGMMAGFSWAALFGLIFFLLMSFLFSVIFWAVYNSMVKSKKTPASKESSDGKNTDSKQ